MACVIGEYCHRHQFVHGAEAEELRERLEQVIENNDRMGATNHVSTRTLRERADVSIATTSRSPRNSLPTSPTTVRPERP